MTPAEFTNEIVIPTVIEFRDERGSRRRAYLACIVALSLKDHLARAGEKEVEDRMRSVSGHAFDVVKGIGNGSKHAGTGRNHIVAFRPGTDHEIAPGEWGFFSVYGVNQWYMNYGHGGRYLETEQFGTVDIYGAVRTTLQSYVSNFPDHFKECDLLLLQL